MVGMSGGILDATQTFWASDALRDALMALGERIDMAPGQVLFRQGEDVRGVFILLQGKVRLSLADRGIFYQRWVSTGGVLGLPATMCLKPYSLSAEAEEPLSAVFIAHTTVKEFLRTRPDLCFEVVEILAREVREMRYATSAVAASTV